MKRVLRLLSLVSALALPLIPLRAIVDLNGDGLDDIWALKYNAAGLSASGDTDGDGISNHDESVMGTDPLKPDSVVKIKAITVDGSGVHLTFPTLAGKRYQVQNNTSLAPAGWTNLGAATAGTDQDYTNTISTPGAAQYFYRVLIGDTDTDGDGVSDWDEIQLGFDPNSTHSHGLNGVDDLTAVTQGLQAANVVSIVAGAAAVTEPPMGNVSTSTGSLTVTRSGGFGPITVHYTTGGSATAGSDYTTLSGLVTLGMGVNSATITVVPLADTSAESPEAVIATLTANAAYTIGFPSIATVMINDYTQANGTGLMGQFWEEGSGVTLDQTHLPTFTAVPANPPLPATPTSPVLFAGLNDTTAFWAAATNHPAGLTNDGYWSSRWTGEVLPAYSQIYTFTLETNFAGRMYVGGQLVVNNWPTNVVVKNAQVAGTIELQAGVRYPVTIEHYQDAGSGRCYLRWSSANQPLEFVPPTRLFPNPAPQILSATEVVLLKNSGPFTYQIAASSNPTSYSAANLPGGWTFSTSTGVIGGSPSQVGTWQIPITASNAAGSGSAVLTLTVIDTGGAITRDVWTGTYANVPALPLASAPSSTSLVTSLEGPQAPGGSDYGSRLRGYITAPVTGNYQFWLAANDNAELLISDDDEPINLFLRCVTNGATGYRDWANANVGKSPLLYLKGGQRYYVEVRHVDGGANGHVSVGWLKPGQTGIVPSEVVPGYALSPWVQPTGQTPNGTLYLANLIPQGGALTIASGISTLRLSTDQVQAVITIDYANLSSPFLSMHVHDDLIPNPPGGLDNVICDIEQPGDATKQADGSYLWVIQPHGAYSAAQLVDHLNTGHIYFNVHSTNYPGGEIKNYYHVLSGAETFTAPALQTFTDSNSAADTASHLNANGAARFLTQATFGATSAEIASVQSLGFEGWIDAQADSAQHPITHHRDYVEANRNVTDPNNSTYPTSLTTNSWWKNSITANDQLRQRVAFAISQITVVSSAGVLEDRSQALTYFYDTLLDNSFGNFKDLLKAVTLTPAMGIYLDMRKNNKPNLGTGLHANENYAREIQQLFSIGLYRMWPDGSLMLNSKGAPIPTYDQDVITGFANCFTGWNYNQPNAGGFLPTNFSPGADDINPMKEVPSRHFTGPKRILNNVVLPGLPTLPSLGNAVLDPYGNHSDAQIQTPEYQALPAQELEATHAALFKHPNCGPFICRQLIQRMVTSTPSPGYLYRVVQAFNGERNIQGVATGVRGNMKDVIKAILLDYEARSTVVLTQQGYGKQREPVLRVTGPARAFVPASSVAGTYTQDGGVITVNTLSFQHLLVSGNSVALDFSGAGAQATSGVYTVSGAFPATPTTFPVRAKDCIRSTYSQSSTTVTVTSGAAHGLVTGDSTYLRFRDGAGKPADGVFGVTFLDATHFTVVVPTSATITGMNCDVAFLRGEYVQSGTTVTITTTTNHGLSSGANVTFTFDPVVGQAGPANGTYPITVTDTRHFTFTAADSASRSGTINAASTSLVLNRTGNTVTNFQNWQMGDTDDDLAQTPMRSPTVFNYFVPDFQFPGTVADAGLYTPEFQLTSDTNVVRQANFLFGGVFSSGSDASAGSSTGITSFRNGGGQITMDFSPWMANGPGGVPWTNDVNVSALIDQLNTLLLAGQLPAAAKTKIQNYVLTLPSSFPIVSITAGNPCELRVTGHGLATGAMVTISGVTGGTFSPSINGTFPITMTSANRFTVPVNCTSISGLNVSSASVQSPTYLRDRIRAIVHLIITSPDFTIQK